MQFLIKNYLIWKLRYLSCIVKVITYAALDEANNQVLPLSPKKKSIKADFIKEADKTNKYLADHSGSINDEYLTNFVSYMNE